MNAAHQRRLSPWLGGLAIILGIVLLLLLGGLGRSAHWVKPRSLAPLPPMGSSADLPHAVQLQQFAIVWQKPLFNPDRMPMAHAADGGSDLGDLELTGVIITPDLRMALLHDKKDDREIRLREGEALADGSVTLVEVHPRWALFDAAAGRTELKLPAGAPIDLLKPVANEHNPPAGEAMMRVQSGGSAAPGTGQGARRIEPAQQSSQDHPRESAIERLRHTIQQRRAARAAAAHEGVR
jgi:general secretion pathway protein N